MTNKFKAQKVYWHEKVGYFTSKQLLEEKYHNSKLANSSIGIDDFTIFDSKFEADIHKLLKAFVKQRSNLRLFSQIQVDLSQKCFCTLGYKIDFLIAQNAVLPKGCKIEPFKKDRGLRFDDIVLNPHVAANLLVEAKGFFTKETRHKHLLLEWRGIQHGKDIEIVQQQAQYVSRGSKCYQTLTPIQLLDKLNQRFPKKES